MRNAVVAALLVVAIIASAGVGYFIGVNHPPSTSTGPSSATTQTSCSISGETIGVALRVVRTDYSSNSLVPVANAAVSGGYVVYCNNERQSTPFAPAMTNSSGEVDLFQGGGGVYHLNVTDPQTNYIFQLSVPARPVTATYVTLDITSGNVTTRFCVYGYNCSFGSSQLYQVKFVQESNCPYGSWLIPWAVVINHQTVTQPPNATLPLSYGASRLTDNSTYSTIWFSLPDGTYTYSILPNNMLGQEQSGNVTINGRNVVVQVYAFITAMGCSSTTTVGG